MARRALDLGESRLDTSQTEQRQERIEVSVTQATAMTAERRRSKPIRYALAAARIARDSRE
jgi:hypothetical protein